MKQIQISLLLLLLVAALFSGCNNSSQGSSSISEPTSSVPETPVSPVESNVPSEAPDVSPNPEEPEDTEVSVDHILMEIEAAYGENYPANGELPTEMLESQFGLAPDMYVAAKGVMAMISVNNDQVVVVQAAPGRADDVETALNTARQKKIDDTLQYPANIPKTNAAKVVRHDDFIAFLLVGAVNDQIDDVQSEEAKEFAEQQVQIAVDAFNSVFA